MRTAALLAAALLLTAGCSSTKDPAKAGNPPNTAIDTPAPSPAGPLAWGTPANVEGYKGGKLTVTPVGVLYHRGPYKGVDGPDNGWFVAIAVKAEAQGAPESTAGGAGGGGFSWRGNGQTISAMDGNSPPWDGYVNGFGVDVPIEPGSPETGVVSFDIPAKGGRLLYINPSDQAITSWTLPPADQGTGLDKARKAIAKFS